jgi:parallel beta-helix repeat protein
MVIASVFIVFSSLVASAQTKTLSVAAHGAKCDGRTDDTAAFQAAATAAASSYSSTKVPVTVTYEGTCLINGSIWVQSGVHWRGSGQIRVTAQATTPPSGVKPHALAAYPTFFAINADDVEWDNMEIVVEKPGVDHPYASAIGWFAGGDSAQHSHVKVTNCRISNAAWGIVVFYSGAGNSGSLTDVEIAGNTVTSAVTPPSVYSKLNWDGIHVGGRVTNIKIHNNTVTHRGDAAISLTSEGKDNVVRDATIENNTATDDRIGIDISGANNVEVLKNTVRASYPDKDQTLAFRQVFYGGVFPLNIHTSGNYFESGTGSSGFTTKIDPASGGTSWPSLNSTFENNVIDGPMNPLYIRGSGIVVEGNTFNGRGELFVDYFVQGASRIATSNVRIGANHWKGDAQIHVGGDATLIQNVTVASQSAAGTTKVINDHNVRMVPK